jgi:hypothetical protein
VFAPDLVSGTEQEHIPLAAITAWLWALASTGYVALLAILASDVDDGTAWRSFALTLIVVWLTASAVSIFGPELVTGTDPTRVPLAALIAPPAATLATGFVCLMFALLTLRRGERIARSRTAIPV